MSRAQRRTRIKSSSWQLRTILWLTALLALLASSQRLDTGHGISVSLCFADTSLSSAPAAKQQLEPRHFYREPRDDVKEEKTPVGLQNVHSSDEAQVDLPSDVEDDHSGEILEQHGGKDERSRLRKESNEQDQENEEQEAFEEDTDDIARQEEEAEVEVRSEEQESKQDQQDIDVEENISDEREDETNDAEILSITLPSRSRPSFLLPPDSPTARSPDKTYYLAVDHHLLDGISEVRMSLSTAIYMAQLLNRTLITPPYLYFRTCSSNLLCRDTFPQVTLKNPTTGLNEHRWQVPFEELYDVEHLAKFLPVVTTDEYLRSVLDARPEHFGWALRPVMPKDNEEDKDKLTTTPTATTKMVNRHETIEWVESNGFSFLPPFQTDLFQRLDIKSLFKLDIHKYLYEDQETFGITVDAINVSCATQECGYYGHIEKPGKSINDTQIYFFEKKALRGIQDDFGQHVYHEVVLLTGNPNRFSHQPFVFKTLKNRDRYEDIVVRWIRYSKDIYKAADYLLAKLVQMTEGKNYLAVHYRLGKDFVGKPVPGNPHMRFDLEGSPVHRPLLTIHEHLQRERNLREFERCKSLSPDYDPFSASNLPVPKGDDGSSANEGNDSFLEFPWGSDTDIRIDQIALNDPPSSSSPSASGPAWASLSAQEPKMCSSSCRARYWYLATDERDPINMLIFKNQGAIVLADLMDMEFITTYRRWVGFTDWQGYLDQILAAQGAHFMGTPYSVFSGAIMNLRLNCWGGKERARSSNRFLYQYWGCSLS